LESAVSAAIRVVDLVKTYEGKTPVEAVRGLSLTVERGECFGLLGPNGAGKTTTIEIAEGLLAATSGTVEVLGMRWGGKHDDAIRQKIGISLQETQLAEKLTVLETLRLFRSFYKSGPAPLEVLAKVGLEDKAGAAVGKLSGGQKQRLAVATALVGAPELLFLDEPTTGLDPTSRRALWDVVRAVKAEGCTVLLTTHYMEEAEQLCDRIGIVDRGRLIALGTVCELVERIEGEHVVDFAFAGRAATASDAGVYGALAGVKRVRVVDGRLVIAAAAPHVALPAIVQQVAAAGDKLGSLSTRAAGLEDVFLTLTGRSLAAEGEAGGAHG
jgi:ABC-2 type transport system ATP-binding protein